MDARKKNPFCDPIWDPMRNPTAPPIVLNAMGLLPDC
jgi:hypothetical protein